MATILSIPKALREKLDDEAPASLADLLVPYGKGMESSVVALSEERFERRLTIEVSGLRQHITETTAELKELIAAGEAGLREEMKAGDAALREEMRSGDSALREALAERCGSLDAKISTTESRIVKWMFIFWIGQIGAILGILFAFFR